MICRINKEKFNNFISSLSMKNNDEGQSIAGYEVHFITINLDGAGFSGNNDKWENFLNITFRTNGPTSKKKELV